MDLLEGHLELVRGSVNERFVLATMNTPGQWAGGLRAWGDASSSAGYRATGIAVTDGRMFTVPSDDLGRLVGDWFPFGKHMVMGVYQTVRGIEAAPANASHWSRWARSPPAWTTRSTTRQLRRCVRSKDCATRPMRCSPRWSPWRNRPSPGSTRRIVVERHGGEISFDSKPGETIAHVRLPISR